MDQPAPREDHERSTVEAGRPGDAIVATGQVLEETVNGLGISEDRLFYCRFLFEDIPTPAGTIDILFEVWGLPTPQGP